MELRLIKEKPIEVPKINISTETPAVAPAMVAAPVRVDKPVKAPAPTVAPAIATVPVMNAAPVSPPAKDSVETTPDSKNEEKPNQATSTKEIPKEKSQQAPKAPPKLNDRQSHILLYPCQKCGEPTAFCYLRTVEFEKKETQRYCLVCFERHEIAKREPANVRSTLTSGSTFKKRVTWEAWKLIGILAASIIAICVGLFFAIRNNSKGKQTPSGATIAGATDANGQPAKPGDKPPATANGQPVNSTIHPGSKKPGDPNAAAKPGTVATSSSISDAKAKTAAPPGTAASKSATTTEAKAAAEADAKKAGERIEKVAALAEKEHGAKIAKAKDAADTAKDPNAKDATRAAAKAGDPKKPGENETAKDTGKPGEKDPSKPGDPSAEAPKAASATDTIKEIGKLLPTDEKKAAPKTETSDSEKNSSTATQDDKAKDPAATSAKTAGKGGDSKPSNAKPTISQEKAVELNGKLSKVAAKVAPKLKSASTIASRITDVATRFAPKNALTSGPLERTAARQNDTSEQGDINLDGGTGEDAWDALQREIAESDPSVKLTNSTTAADASGTNAPKSPFTIPGLQPKISGKISAIAYLSNARNIKSNTPTATPPSKKITQLKSTDIVLNDLSGKPRKTATLNNTHILLNSLTESAAKKQTQLNSTEIILNSQISISSDQKSKLTAQKRLNSTEIKLNATEIMLSPFTEVPARKAQLNNTEIVLNSLTGVASEQAKLNSTTTLLRPLVVPNGTASAIALHPTQKPALSGTTTAPPSPKVIVNSYVALPDAFKGEVVIHTLSADTLFDTSPSSLCNIGEDHLTPFADGIKRHPEIPVLIRCYTDNIGTNKESLALSQKRAEAVRIWLIKKTGIPAKNITSIGMGTGEPIASNTYSDGTDNFQGRARNRRITITTPTLMPSKTPEPPVAVPVTPTTPAPIAATTSPVAPAPASIPNATQVTEATPAPVPANTPPAATAAVPPLVNTPDIAPAPIPAQADTPAANKTATPSEAPLHAASVVAAPAEKQPAK